MSWLNLLNLYRPWVHYVAKHSWWFKSCRLSPLYKVPLSVSTCLLPMALENFTQSKTSTTKCPPNWVWFIYFLYLNSTCMYTVCVEFRVLILLCDSDIFIYISFTKHSENIWWIREISNIKWRGSSSYDSNLYT